MWNTDYERRTAKRGLFGTDLAAFSGMPNAQLDQFSRALETTAVVPLVLAVFAAALLGFALKWIENRLVRMFREKKQR